MSPTTLPPRDPPLPKPSETPGDPKPDNPPPEPPPVIGRGFQWALLVLVALMATAFTYSSVVSSKTHLELVRIAQKQRQEYRASKAKWENSESGEAARSAQLSGTAQELSDLFERYDARLRLLESQSD